MSQEKIVIRVVRELSFDALDRRTLYLASVRVGLKTTEEEFRELTKLIHLRAYSAEKLEGQIDKIKSDFQKLLENNPDFLKKIGRREEIEI